LDIALHGLLDYGPICVIGAGCDAIDGFVGFVGR
jgi:hypothetical protein